MGNGISWWSQAESHVSPMELGRAWLHQNHRRIMEQFKENCGYYGLLGNDMGDMNPRRETEGWLLYTLKQQSPTLLVPGTSFMDNFSMDGSKGWFWNELNILHLLCTWLLLLICCDNAVKWAMGSRCKYRWRFAHMPVDFPLECGPVPNKPWTSISPLSGGWGALGLKDSVKSLCLTEW